jgi:hypothetical protein
MYAKIAQASELNLSAEKWFHGCTGSDRHFRGFTNQLGAARLEDMALRAVVRNRRNLEDGALDYVPWQPVGRNILNIIQKK